MTDPDPKESMREFVKSFKTAVMDGYDKGFEAGLEAAEKFATERCRWTFVGLDLTALVDVAGYRGESTRITAGRTGLCFLDIIGRKGETQASQPQSGEQNR